MWRRSNEDLNPKNLLPTVKHVGGGIMVWGYFAAFVFIENNMDQRKYINVIKENLKVSV